MEVTQRLIEKYHLDLCSSEERKAVEEWLLNDDMDTKILFPAEEDTKADKTQMWQNIAEILPAASLPTPAVPKHIRLADYFASPVVRSIAAATVAIVCTTLLLLNKETEPDTVTEVSPVANNNEIIQTTALNITLGTKSKANIHASGTSESNNINFCGIIRIEPKEDVELTVNANCASPSSNTETVSFKKGQTYIAVNYHFTNDSELIIVNEKNLFNLPPVLQKEIIRQFNI